MLRRDTLRFATASLVAFGTSARINRAFAQEYPDKPLRLIVPFTAGGYSDNVARLVAQGLTEQLKVTVVIDNRPGGGGNVAGEIAAKSAPDGYTLVMAGTGMNAINPAIYQKMPFDPNNDLTPVIGLLKGPNMLAVANEVPARSVKELVELAKRKPGELNVGYPGNGTTGHFSAAYFASVAGITWTNVPYRGTPQVLADMLGGAIQVTFDNVTTWAPQAAAGKVRALAVTSAVRSAICPDVPTIAESGFPGFEASGFSGIAVPSATPRPIITKLNAAIQAVLESQDFKSKAFGMEIVGGSPEKFKALIAQDVIKWGKVAKDIGLKVD